MVACSTVKIELDLPNALPLEMTLGIALKSPIDKRLLFGYYEADTHGITSKI